MYIKSVEINVKENSWRMQTATSNYNYLSIRHTFRANKNIFLIWYMIWFYAFVYRLCIMHQFFARHSLFKSQSSHSLLNVIFSNYTILLLRTVVLQTVDTTVLQTVVNILLTYVCLRRNRTIHRVFFSSFPRI